MKKSRNYAFSALLLAVLLSFTACVSEPTESDVSDVVSDNFSVNS